MKKIPTLSVVAAALVAPDGRILLQQRAQGRAMAGLWEVPGGKGEGGETPAAGRGGAGEGGPVGVARRQGGGGRDARSGAGAGASGGIGDRRGGRRPHPC